MIYFEICLFNGLMYICQTLAQNVVIKIIRQNGLKSDF